MIITRYQDYFKAISTYNRAPPERRSNLLKGYIAAIVATHHDPTIRRLVDAFRSREEQRLAS